MTGGDPPALEPDYHDAARARALVREDLAALNLTPLIDDVELVASELVTNALLHGGGCAGVRLVPFGGGVRIEVRDRRSRAPMLGSPTADGMTGRGMRLVASLASRWGVERLDDGKVVWVEVTGTPLDGGATHVGQVALANDQTNAGSSTQRFHVVLGDVPTDLLLAAKSHVDNLIREFALAASGARAGVTHEVVPHLRGLIDTIAFRFTEARDAIKRQALAAAAAGATHTRLELDLTAEAAGAGEAYLEALDAVDAYCRAARLLTLETPPQHRVFRRWYVEELIVQLRALARGETPPAPQPFETRLLHEIERVAAANRIAERAARLFEVAGALAVAATPEAVADAVLDQGVAALGASGGGMLLSSSEDRLVVPGTVGYDEDVVARLRSESGSAELPAAVALRTGEAVWIESRAERDGRFPELSDLEPATLALCAVPLEVAGLRLGALRFSFNKPRLFDADERRFVLTLAAQTALALKRAQLQADQLDASARLQRSLLPHHIPDIPGVEVAAGYHPLGTGMDVGGDLYDVWTLDGSRHAFAIGDVAGTGPEAAATNALVRFSLRALTLREPDQAETLRMLNSLLASASADEWDEVFCTALFGVLALRDDGGVNVRLAAGGHPYPFLRRSTGEVTEVPLGGSLLGLLPEIDVATADLQLGARDALVAFTDGVVEARDEHGEMFGPLGVQRVLTQDFPNAQAIVDALEAAVVAHVGGELVDDVAILVLRVLG